MPPCGGGAEVVLGRFFYDVLGRSNAMGRSMNGDRARRSTSFVQNRRRQARGFTLVEVIVTLAIVAISTAVVIPALNNVTRADLRRSARGLSSTIRQSYDEAALSGQMQRIVFFVGEAHKNVDADNKPKAAVRVESAEEALLFATSGGAFVTAAGQGDGVDSLEAPPFAAEADSDKTPGEAAPPKAAKQKAGRPGNLGAGQSGHRRAFAALASINKLAQGDEEDHFKPKRIFSLGRDVHILDVWTEGMDQPLSDGEVSLFFFAHGYTQNAVVHLEDASKNVFTIFVASLTGRTQVVDGYVERHKR